MALDEVSEQLLSDIFFAFLKSPDSLDARKYRADNDQFITELDKLEKLGYLDRTNNIYFFRPLALAVVSEVYIDAAKLVDKCDLVFHILRGTYKDNPGQRMTGLEIANKTGLTENDVMLALAIIIKSPILASYSSNPFKENAYIEPSENILRYKSFEDLLKQIQEWAKEQDNRSHESMKIDIPSPEYSLEQSIPLSESRANWVAIKNEYGFTKRSFGRRINFVKDSFKRAAIYRDVEQAFILERSDFSKPAVILAGGVIEELLRLYLKQKDISPQKPLKKDFYGYIQTCEQKGILKAGIASLSDFARHFRNLVHLSNEETKRHAISKSAAKNAVASIFTIANDF